MGIFALALFVFFAQAEKFTYPQQRLLAKGVEKIQIIGVNGQVKLTGRAGKSYRLRVRHTKNKTSQDWSLSVDRRGDTLVLEVFSVAYGAQWRAHVRKELWPEFDIQLDGPPKPVAVSWRAGEMHVGNWTAPLEASKVEGKVRIRQGGGSYSLHLGESDVDVEDWAGELRVRGERGRVSIAKLTGELTLNWRSGDVLVKSLVGRGQLDVGQGMVRIEGMKGRLQAEGQGATWTLADSQFDEVEIQSESGPVHWEKNKGGAKVFLTSNSGEIRGLKLAPILDSEGRKVSEFAIGKKPYAQVFVRTESGPIHFRQKYP